MMHSELDDDYFMGMALMSAARVKTERCMLAVDDLNCIHIGFGELLDREAPSSPHFAMMLSCRNRSVRCVYSTFTPSRDALGDLTLAGVARIVYFKTCELDNLCEKNLLISNLQTVEYQGNLNWLADRIFWLRSRDIF